MRPYGSFYASLWVLMNPYKYLFVLKILMGGYGSLLVLICLYESSLVFMRFYASLLVVMGFYKSFFVFMDCNESLCVLKSPYVYFKSLCSPMDSTGF